MERLSTGEVGRVEASWEMQLLFKDKTVVRGAEWRDRMATALLWLE